MCQTTRPSEAREGSSPTFGPPRKRCPMRKYLPKRYTTARRGGSTQSSGPCATPMSTRNLLPVKPFESRSAQIDSFYQRPISTTSSAEVVGASSPQPPALSFNHYLGSYESHPHSPPDNGSIQNFNNITAGVGAHMEDNSTPSTPIDNYGSELPGVTHILRWRFDVTRGRGSDFLRGRRATAPAINSAKRKARIFQPWTTKVHHT